MLASPDDWWTFGVCLRFARRTWGSVRFGPRHRRQPHLFLALDLHNPRIVNSYLDRAEPDILDRPQDLRHYGVKGRVIDGSSVKSFGVVRASHTINPIL